MDGAGSSAANDGLVEAFTDGSIESDGILTNTGTIIADGGIVSIYGMVSGGTIFAVSGGTIQLGTGPDGGGVLDAVTLAGDGTGSYIGARTDGLYGGGEGGDELLNVSIESGITFTSGLENNTALGGDIANSGVLIAIPGGPSAGGAFVIDGPVTLTGTGTLVINSILEPGTEYTGEGFVLGLTPGADVLTNIANTIEGSGEIDTALVNEAAGVITGQGLSITGSVANQGTIEAFTSGAVTMEGSVTNTGTIDADGGIINVQAAVTNDGVIEVAGQGGISIAGAVTGTGIIIDDPATIQLDGPVSAGQTVEITGEGATLSLGDAPQFAGKISGFGYGDVLDLASLSGISATTLTTGNNDVLTVTYNDGASSLNLTFSNGGAGQNFSVVPEGDSVALQAQCFCAGTRILTADDRLVVVEDLRVGERLEIYSGEPAEIIWIGRRTIPLSRHPRPEAARPVLISAGALGGGIPWRDLVVSPDHAMYLDGHLIPAKTLINGFSIRQLTRTSVTYYHIEFAEHAVLFAEGAAAESYLDTGNRAAFENGGPAMVLHPDFAQGLREAKGCAPFVEAGSVVEAVRQRILDRAGIETTDDAALTIRIEKGSAIIESRSAIPGEIFADPRDRRRLGVKIATLEIAGRLIALGEEALSEGWHDAEADGRWTNGRAVVPASLMAGSQDIRLTLAAVLRYPAIGAPTTQRTTGLR